MDQGKYRPRYTRNADTGRYISGQQWWWVIYCQDLKRPRLVKTMGTGARYALQTFLGTKAMVKSEFGAALVDYFDKRGPAIELLQELNIIDSVQNS